MKIFYVSDSGCVKDELFGWIESCATKAIKERGIFTIGLSGGSMPNQLEEIFDVVRSDYDKWKLFFCDERYVPENDGDSTFGAYKKAWLSRDNCALKESQFARINIKLDVNECAKDYEKQIRNVFKLSENSTEIPAFDLLLLGLGPDGHTCSLFPGHKLLSESTKLVAPISDSPKPPPKRVTMTYPLINNAQCCLFPLAGESKADIVKKIITDKEDFPAGRINPEKGELVWILDAQASKHLSPDTEY
uniref:6-phosphogluconolactonase n=1 Tax=Corethrella appendiculata TaxID=1370023 RepID=U5EWT6_9DIPT